MIQLRGEPPVRAHPRVVIVGGGISGLAAAVALRDEYPNASLVMIERANELGGKLRTAEVGGQRVEAGAEALLIRRPEAVEFAHRIGLDEQLRYPVVTKARVWSEGALRGLPERTLLGVPADVDAVAVSELVPRGTIDALRAEPDQPGQALDSDLSVGAVIRARLGAQHGEYLLDRLVDPLLGGVYAGRADDLSVAATMPALVAQMREQPSLVTAAQRALATATPGPVFASVHSGLSRLIDAARKASQVEIHYGQTVRGLRRVADGWRVLIGPTQTEQEIQADAVVLATPARPTSRLLETVAPHVAAKLAAIDYASVAVAALVLPPITTPGSGFLVANDSALRIKAATFVSNKWGGDTNASIIRASFGRCGEEQLLHRDDAELVEIARSDLAAVLGHDLPPHHEARIFRWGGALPQYRVGHRETVRQMMAGLEDVPTLALCGAAYDGVGVAACIASGRAAAARVATGLRERAAGTAESRS